MKSFTLTNLALASASTVTLTTTPCLDSSISIQQVSIDINTAAPVRLNLASICGLQVLSASSDVDMNSITCQAFKDAKGTQSGSEVFSYAEPALIATNPVPEESVWVSEGSVWCNGTATKTAAPTVFRRQEDTTNGTTTSISNLPTGASASASSAERPSLIISTVVFFVTTSSWSANATMLSTGTATPSATQTESAGVPSESGNVAVKKGAGIGALVGVVAALVL